MTVTGVHTNSAESIKELNVQKRIFVVEDDSSVRSYLFTFLTVRGYAVECFESGEQLLTGLSAGETPGLVLMDVVMPDCSGIKVVEKIQSRGRNIPIVMLSGISDVRSVVESMQLGALDFLIKPFDEAVLESTIEDVFEKRQAASDADEASGFIVRNRKMARIRDILKRVAHTDVPILILGESGVGKEVVARYVHARSGRGERPFVKVNCAAVPDNLLESELFGYDRGAFTGALNDKTGKFEQAHGGTLLLDEIGEMTPNLQAKLLHVLQDGTFSRLGAKKSIQVDARIIAATNINLKDAIAERRFREDLYYRLNVISVDVPPLRERVDEIPILCAYYLNKHRHLSKTPSRELSSELMQSFLQYAWPGNIRQLENVIKRFLILDDSRQVLSETSADWQTSEKTAAVLPAADLSLIDVGAQAADRAQRVLILKTLGETGWNRKAAATRLNICYKALLNKIKRWDLCENLAE